MFEELFRAIAEIASKVPNFEERLLKKYMKELERYEKELSKPVWDRDAALIDDLHDKLRRYVQTFTKSLAGK